MTKDRSDMVEIGDAHGLIAIYFDEQQAWDYYHALHTDDAFRPELLAAINVAYPESERGESDL